MINLSSPVMSLSRVGRQVAGQLKNLGVKTVYDLLFYFPSRYEDWSKIVKISDLKPGENATVRGKVELIQNKRSRWRKTVLTEAVIADESGSLIVGWFHQPYLTDVLHIGDAVYLSGKIDDGRDGEWQMVSPVYEKDQGRTLHTARIVPIYPSTSRLSQKQIRFLITQAIPTAKFLEEWLPLTIVRKLKLMPLKLAVSEVHFPSTLARAEEARRRFKFEELFMLQLLAQIFRRDLEQGQAPKIIFNEALTKEFVASLPFQLTDDQRKAAWEILCDIKGHEKIPLNPPFKKGEAGGFIRPMNRLLEGEVGSGKTLVAALAILNAIKSGFQVAFMAPTEILAGQHYETFSNLFNQFGIKVGLSTRSHTLQNPPQSPFSKGGDKEDPLPLRGSLPFAKGESERDLTKGEAVRDLQKGIKSGKIQMIIGTHALIQEKVKFKNLGLAIIDEQHRFGVEQRQALREKSGQSFLPHLLSMTATPIPRTLSLAFYGDLDISIIKQLPKERKKIITEIVDKESQRKKVYDFIREEIKNNHRVFILCPLIDPSDKLGFKSVKAEYEVLRKSVFADVPLGMMHGRLKSAEREKLMEDFRAGRTPILLTTTVVEVGVDVPQATVMIIESAERFGLSQLHQLRGRIGRGQAQGYCFLMVNSSLGDGDFYPQGMEKTLSRLQSFLDCQDGFALAERDLELRGPGEIWGATQSGFPEFKIASVKDVEILKQARQEAQDLVRNDPKLLSWPLVREKVDEFIAIARNG
ncbi:MAG: ATP-dependent DNA helicase RecG [bacterium]|nr:ATP-dependent DNA helicase RecG [bacterium]